MLRPFAFRAWSEYRRDVPGQGRPRPVAPASVVARRAEERVFGRDDLGFSGVGGHGAMPSVAGPVARKGGTKPAGKGGQAGAEVRRLADAGAGGPGDQRKAAAGFAQDRTLHLQPPLQVMPVPGEGHIFGMMRPQHGKPPLLRPVGRGRWPRRTADLGLDGLQDEKVHAHIPRACGFPDGGKQAVGKLQDQRDFGHATVMPPRG